MAQSRAVDDLKARIQAAGITCIIQSSTGRPAGVKDSDEGCMIQVLDGGRLIALRPYCRKGAGWRSRQTQTTRIAAALMGLDSKQYTVTREDDELINVSARR